jgi:hypothetical protein
MKNIHVISTSKPSKLLKDLVDKTYQFKKEVSFGNRIELPLNIYITSDEEIVLNCYHFNSKYGDEPQKTNQRDIDSRKYWEEEDYYISKIILTTDQALIKDGVQAIDDEFLELFVKNPSCEVVEVSYGVLKPFQSIYKGYMIHLPNNEVLELKAELSIYREIVSKSNFAPMLIKEKQVEETIEPEAYQREMLFTQRQIEHLQYQIFQITGEGEVMQLFNKLLCINAGS